MKVLCKKAISRDTGEDLRESSPWVKIDKEYVVLAFVYTKERGFDMYIESENYSELALISFSGFEFISQYISSSWVTEVSNKYGEEIIKTLPGSWNYESFFDDLEDEEEHAMKLFHEEAQKIYDEEEQYAASKNK